MKVTEINETTHLRLCGEDMYMKTLSISKESMRYMEAYNECQSFIKELAMRIQKEYPSIKVEAFGKTFIKFYISRIGTGYLKIRVYFHEQSCWVSKADIENAMQQKKERDDELSFQRRKDEQLKSYLQAYIGEIPEPFTLEYTISHGVITWMCLRCSKATGGYCLLFDKYRKKKVDDLLASEEFKEDIFTRLPIYMELYDKLRFG